MWLIFASFFIFLLGLAFGSFMNAFEYRLKVGKDFINDRSICPHCKHVLGALDLIPLLSWLWLRGKCRYCSKSISKQYPIVELATGIGFVVYFLSLASLQSSSQGLLYFDSSASSGQAWLSMTILLNNMMSLQFISTLIFGLLVIWGLIFFTLYDIKHGLILDKVLFPIIGISLVWYALPFISFFNLPEADFFIRVLSGFGAGAFFFIIIWITKGQGMGGGDMKMALWLGLLTGFPGIVYSLYIAFLVGGGYGAFLLLFKQKSMKQSIPFGPFLAIATMVVFVFGERVAEVCGELFF